MSVRPREVTDLGKAQRLDVEEVVLLSGVGSGNTEWIYSPKPQQRSEGSEGRRVGVTKKGGLIASESTTGHYCDPLDLDSDAGRDFLPLVQTFSLLHRLILIE